MMLLPQLELGRARSIVVLYAALGAGWVGVSRGLVPPIIAGAFEGRSLSVLNRFFRGRTPHPVEHYLAIWNVFSEAVLIAGALHLAIVLVVGRLVRRHHAAEARDVGGINVRSGRLLIAFAMAFLVVTVLSGPRHDYVADLEIWDAVLRGDDPWWLVAGGRIPLNAYGPLFNALAGLAWVNPMAPKLLFAFSYLAFVIWLVEDAGVRRGVVGLPRFGLAAWLLNPFPWVEIAWFGHFDILVAVACVAAVHGRARGRDVFSGVSLAAGILLKYLPLVILPFLAFDRRRFRARLFLAAVLPVVLGLGCSVLFWGPSTIRPLRFAAIRGSLLLSIFRFLRGTHSPLHLLWDAPDVDFLALPCLALAGASVFAWCWWRRVDPATSALLAVLTTLLFYRVGFIQYQMVPFVLGSYWALSPWGPSARDRFLAVSAGIYFGWLALFDVYLASFGGIIHPEDPWAWVEDVVGLPMFLAGSLLLASLLRFSSGRRGLDGQRLGESARPSEGLE
jgi:hypothetical protein